MSSVPSLDRQNAEMCVRWALAFSNFVATYANDFAVSNYGELSPASMLITTLAVSSFLMHMSETKHSIDPGFHWRSWSRTFLNFDRLVVLTSLCYFTYLCWDKVWSITALDMWGTGLVGIICNLIGERTESLGLYGLLHLAWHFGGYYLITRAMQLDMMD